MILRWTIWVACTLAFFAGKAQLFGGMEKLRTIEGAYRFITTDNLNNLYLLGNTGQLKKLNANGDSVAVFNEVRKYGGATFVDASNPVKILLYYSDFGTILVLDGMLQVRNTIDLRRSNILSANPICLSYDGKIWLFDTMEKKLKKLDEKGNVTFQTTDFRQLFNPVPTPVSMFDYDGYLYLYDSAQGIYVFDYYGAFKNRLLVTNKNNLSFMGKNIFATDSSAIYRYEASGLRYDEFSMPDDLKQYRQYVFRANLLYALNDKGVDIFRLSP
ncbi:MAG: hypothetical protein QM727_06590 [Niabella sp.]